MTVVTKDCYESGVLDEDIHSQLIANLPKILARAGIAGHQEAVWTPLSETCGARELDWVTNLWSHAPAGNFGLFYDLDRVKNAIERMVALTGCLIRHFVNVRLLTLSQAIDERHEEDREDDVSVLIIPNFFIPGNAKDTPPWRKAAIHELLMARMMAGNQTIVGIQEPDRMIMSYGKQITSMIKTNYPGVLK